MKLIKVIFIFCVLNINFHNLYAKEKIFILAIVDNHPITNIDLNKEINIKKYLENNPNLLIDKNLILEEMIINKIKELEINKNKININENYINEILKKNLIIEVPDLIKNEIKKKISISNGWSQLINMKFKNKLSINTNEIKERISTESDRLDKIKILEIEKNKKLNILSQTYYNEIQKKYFVKKF